MRRSRGNSSFARGSGPTRTREWVWCGYIVRNGKSGGSQVTYPSKLCTSRSPVTK